MPDNLSNLSGRKGLDNNLFEKLQESAWSTGTPDREDLRKLAEEYLIGDAITYGTASFYDFLKPENAGKKVYICSGSVCLMAGTQDRLKNDLKEYFSEDEIGHMCCLGRCHENGSFHYNGKNYSAQSSEDITNIVKNGSISSIDSYTVESNAERPVLTADFPGVDEYYSLLEESLKKNPDALLRDIKDSCIRGRGGAGFPMGFKLESCKNTKSKQKYIVCNADEGDPGAFSDRYLLEKRPHSVLFGMIIAGYIVGADTGVLYIRAEYPEAVEIVTDAVQDLQSKGLLGINIKNSGFNYKFKVIKAAGAYICGEETALLSSIEGQRPEVRIRPPYPTEEGLFNKPTIVNNVETLAAVHFILRNCGKKYAEIGTKKSSGTKLVSLDSFFNKPGMYEVIMGTPFSVVVNEMGGGFRVPVKALHVGGPLGGLVPVDKINDLTLDFDSFAENGFLLGHASVICIPEEFPLVKYLEHLFEFTADESCGKCFPCRIGSVRGQELLEKAQKDSYKIDKELFEDLLETMEVGSLCAHGGGLPLSIRNALQYFSDELKPYFAESTKSVPVLEHN